MTDLLRWIGSRLGLDGAARDGRRAGQPRRAGRRRFRRLPMARYDLFLADGRFRATPREILLVLARV